MLPRRRPARNRGPPPRSGKPMHAPRAGLSVLVVDDSRDNAESLAILLGFDGHRVRVAFSGPQALTAVAEEAPDVMILDVRMPGMDGLDVARRVAAGRAPGSRAPKIVAGTGLQ